MRKKTLKRTFAVLVIAVMLIAALFLLERMQ